MAYDSGNIFAKIIAGDIPCHKVCMRAPVRVSTQGLCATAQGGLPLKDASSHIVLAAQHHA